MSVYSYQNKIILTGEKIAGGEGCCCISSGICCFCIQTDTYTTFVEFDERKKPWAGTVPKDDGEWYCIRYYETENGDIVPVEGNDGPPGGSTFRFERCAGTSLCRGADFAWDIGFPVRQIVDNQEQQPIFIKVNEGTDGEIGEPWERGIRASACNTEITRSGCIECSGVASVYDYVYDPDDPDAYLAFFNNICGCWNNAVSPRPKGIVGDRKCCVAGSSPNEHGLPPAWHTQNPYRVQICRAFLDDGSWMWIGDSCLCCPSGTVPDGGSDSNVCIQEGELL
jgi:hypothetical protein